MTPSLDKKMSTIITAIIIATPDIISHKQPNMHPAESRMLSLKLPPKAHAINPIIALIMAIQMIMLKIIMFYFHFVHTKNTAFAFSMQGVWHNPRIKKQKQYIPVYALTCCQSYSLFISCQTYCIDD